MINLYVKFNVHSSYAKQFNSGGQTNGRMHPVTTIGILRPKTAAILDFHVKYWSYYTRKH